MLKHRHNAQMVAAICALTLSACGPGPTSPTASSPPSPGTSSSPVSGVQPTAGPTTPNSATELTVKLQADSALSVFATQQVNEFPLCLARISRASTRISLDASLPESARAALTAAGVSLSSENGKTILTIERELNLAVLLAGVELHFGAVPDGNAEGRTTFFDHDGKELGFVSWQASLSSAARSISVRLKPHGTVNASESCPSLDAEVSGATFLGAGGQVVATQPLPNPQTSPSSEPSPGPSASPVGPAPGAPLNAKVVEQTSSSLTLQWDFPADARSFRLYLDGVQVAQDYVSPNYYRFEGLRSSTTYRLGVQSVNPAGSSEIVTVTTATTGSGSTASGNFSGGGSSGRRITTGKLTAEAIGDEFQVNENTTRIQIFSPVAMDADGDFVVAWTEFIPVDDGYFEIHAQRYNPDGEPKGEVIIVSDENIDEVGFPAVAIDKNGDFAVVWQEKYEDDNDSDILIRRYNANGQPLGSEFRVNTYTTNDQESPEIAMNAAGEFVVSWNSENQDGNSNGVYAQRFDADGDFVGSEFQVNTYTTSTQQDSAVAIDADGNFTIIWNSIGQDGDDFGVFGQRFRANGTPKGEEFQVNTYTFSGQSVPAIAMDADGDFVVTWDSTGQDGYEDGIFGQRFDAEGDPKGEEFQVNTTTTNDQTQSRVAMDKNGDFVVTWFSETGGRDIDIFAQLFNAAGSPQGSEIQVNTYTTSIQVLPYVAMDGDGDFVITWSSKYTGDGPNSEIVAQRYKVTH